MGKVYITVGLAGSGKSTYIKNHLPNLPVVSRDKIRADLGYTQSENHKTILSKEEENHVTEIQYQTVTHYCQQNKDFVVDGMNNRKMYRKELTEIIRSFPNMEIVCLRFYTPLEICIQRREGQIAESTMHFLSDSFEELETGEYDSLHVVNWEDYQ